MYIAREYPEVRGSISSEPQSYFIMVMLLGACRIAHAASFISCFFYLHAMQMHVQAALLAAPV